MFKKLERFREEYKKLETELTRPEIINNRQLYAEKVKRHSELGPLMQAFDAYEKALASARDSEDMLKTEADPDMKELAQSELDSARGRAAELEREIKSLLVPKDPDDPKNAIMEIRAGTGGDEAGLFAAELFRMYTRFAEANGFKLELMESSPTELGGMKEVIFTVSGRNPYGTFKYESGTHRVQRVPQTETGGRVHTSAVTVAVLPEQEEKDFEIKPEELKIEVCRASGAGGQHVNKTESAVRITHLPTGLEVYCQDGRSQIKNKEKAMTILRARVKDRLEGEDKAKLDSTRKAQIGSGDRSEKIRTYNFPQNRLTDHRINLTLYNLADIMEGEIGEVLKALSEEDNKRKLAAEG